jgi:YfiH family protein
MNQNTWSDYSEYFNNDNLKVGFTNKYFPHDKPKDRIEFARLLGLNSDKIVKPIQVHSNKVVHCSQPGEYQDIDGVIGNRKELVLSIQVADCIPIFLFDLQTNVIGLVHAGWRGVSKNIVSSIVDKLDKLNSKVENVKVLLGPSIRQCCFEIGPEVAELFYEKYLKKGQGDRSFLDLQGYVTNQFINNEFNESQIIDKGECTCCSDKYHSYRRNGQKAGRMIAMMGF